MRIKILKKITDVVKDFDIEFQGKHDDEEISSAEALLSVKLPEQFKLYLAEFGNIAFDAIEYLGLTNTKDFEFAKYPNFVWFNLQKRESSQLPKHLIVFKNIDNQEYVCIDTNRILLNGDCGITVWDRLDRVISEELEIGFVDYLDDDLNEYYG